MASTPLRRKQFEVEASRVGLVGGFFYALPGDEKYDDNCKRFDSFCKSQLQIVKDFLNSGKKTLLSLEDDCIFDDCYVLSEAISQLPDDWDILYLGANITDPFPERINKNLFKIKAAWTTHAIGYNRKVCEFIADNYVGWEANGMYDDWLSRIVLPKFNCYVVSPMIATQRDGYSALWDKEVSYGWIESKSKLV